MIHVACEPPTPIYLLQFSRRPATVWLDWLVEASLYWPDVQILNRMATRV